MSDFTKEQRETDTLARRRKVYQNAALFISAPQTKDFAETLVKRIEKLRDSYIEDYDGALPEDSISIAKFQSARKTCNTILRDFDADVCKKAIEDLDAKIKTIHNTIEKKKARKPIGGFSSL